MEHLILMKFCISVVNQSFSFSRFFFCLRYDDFYFLTDPENFINSHCPDEAQWQLLDDPIPLDQFERRVLKTSEFYCLGLTLIYPKNFHLVTGELTPQNWT